jgi:hypothetical protein
MSHGSRNWYRSSSICNSSTSFSKRLHSFFNSVVNPQQLSSRLDSAQPNDLVRTSFLIDSVIRIAFHYFFPATCYHNHLTALQGKHWSNAELVYQSNCDSQQQSDICLFYMGNIMFSYFLTLIKYIFSTQLQLSNEKRPDIQQETKPSSVVFSIRLLWSQHPNRKRPKLFPSCVMHAARGSLQV